MARFNPQRAAAILAEAEFWGDKHALSEYKVCPTTLWNWRKRLEKDADFLKLFECKKKELSDSWRKDAILIMKTAARKLTTQIRDDGDLKRIYAVAGAMKIVGELKITGDALSESDPDWQSEPSQETQSRKD